MINTISQITLKEIVPKLFHRYINNASAKHLCFKKIYTFLTTNLLHVSINVSIYLFYTIKPIRCTEFIQYYRIRKEIQNITAIHFALLVPTTKFLAE